jgi:ketosteroid isomerase-like protein
VARGWAAALLVADRGGVTELLRNGYELMPREGVGGIAHLLDPEFEVQTAAELPEAGTYQGVDEFEGLLETLGEPFEDISFEPGEFIELSENLLIVPLRILGRGKLSNVPLDIEVVHVWTMRDRKALRLRVFTRPEDAMAALMRDAYEAYNSGGFDSIGALLDPDVVLHEEPEIPDGRTRHGPREVAQYFVEGTERWRSFELEVDQVIQVAAQVIVVTGVMRGRGSLSGADVESRFGHVYELESWRAKRMTFYFDSEKALEAARRTLDEAGTLRPRPSS